MILDADLEKSNGKFVISEKSYKKEMKALEAKLSELQHVIADHKVPVLIVFEGWSAAGKGTQIAKTLAPLDPRFFNVHTMAKTSEDALMRPFLWNYARHTPSDGQITIFDKSWYRLALPESLAKRKLLPTEISGFYYDATAFERQLKAAGTVVVKIFLHISKEEQKRRFDEMEKVKDKKWRVNEDDRRQNKEYDKNLKQFEELIEKSEWEVVEANDGNYATVKIYKHIIAKIEEEVSRKEAAAGSPVVEFEYAPSAGGVLASCPTLGEISDKEYKEKIDVLQGKIAALGYKLYSKRKSVVIVYEGWDAAGKGGNIKRLTNKLDPRGYEVVPIAAPTQVELNHHYLWRFWRVLPKDGHIAVFDRSWYGRVMVERIEGFCSENDWKRAYGEINDFEAHLRNHGVIVLKFWLHIDKDEQLSRFKARQDDPSKQYKITDEDWRNRDKWPQYEAAVSEMLEKTNTPGAPWIVVESDNKKFARVKTLEYVVNELEKRLK